MKLFLVKYISFDGYSEGTLLSVAENEEDVKKNMVKDIMKNEEDTDENDARERVDMCDLNIQKQDEIIDGYKIILEKV